MDVDLRITEIINNNFTVLPNIMHHHNLSSIITNEWIEWGHVIKGYGSMYSDIRSYECLECHEYFNINTINHVISVVNVDTLYNSDHRKHHISFLFRLPNNTKNWYNRIYNKEFKTEDIDYISLLNKNYYDIVHRNIYRDVTINNKPVNKRDINNILIKSEDAIMDYNGLLCYKKKNTKDIPRPFLYDVSNLPKNGILEEALYKKGLLYDN